MLDCDHCRALRHELEAQGGPPPMTSREFDTRMIAVSPKADPGSCACACHDVWRTFQPMLDAASR